MNGASKYPASSTACLNFSKCGCHGSVIFTFPIGDPMLITPIPLSESLLRISAHSVESKSITFLLFTPRNSKCVIPFSLHVTICSFKSAEISSANADSFNMVIPLTRRNGHPRTRAFLRQVRASMPRSKASCFPSPGTPGEGREGVLSDDFRPKLTSHTSPTYSTPPENPSAMAQRLCSASPPDPQTTTSPHATSTAQSTASPSPTPPPDTPA